MDLLEKGKESSAGCMDGVAMASVEPQWSLGKQEVWFGVFRTVDLRQQYDTVSHVGGIVFHSIQQSTLVYHTRRDTLLYLTKSSIILDIHFGALHST